MKMILFLLNVGGVCLFGASAVAAAPAMSDASSECMECHAVIHPGIVKDWRNSRHAQITPKQAMRVEGLSRKVSSPRLPKEVQDVSVGCAECHGLRPKAHADTVEHNGHDIHVVVSPEDCAVCHAQEGAEYTQNLMSQAHGNLAGNPLFQQLEQSINGRVQRNDDRISFTPASADTKAETCYYCHGTRLTVTGFETRDTELAGELKLPVIEGWPNQGVGRINPDGSKGACSACHARHEFSIEMARKPYTCMKCHIGPDVPAYKVYSASKHGNIFSAMEKSWNFEAVPWTIGKDFTAPTCAACHISLLVNSDGDQVSGRTHQMADRLPWRIFGLVYAHPHPKDPDTSRIRNSSDQPLPTDLSGGEATAYLIDKKEQEKRKQAMQAACMNCHDTSWVDGFWRRFESTIQETNAMTLAATQIMAEIWQSGFASGAAQGANPFDEAIEKKWMDIWQFYANASRFSSAMAGGGDYGVYAGGRYQASQAILEMNDWLMTRRAGKPK